MLRHRVVEDVSELPTNAFGVRDLMWWGTLGFIVVEGFTLVLTAVVYLYTTDNFATWPPAGTLRPSVIAPSINVAIMLLSLPVMRKLHHAAHAWDLVAVRRWLTVGTGFAIAFNAFRLWELTRSLNTRWDANAYASAQWLVVGAHGTLLAIQLVEVAGMAAIFWLGPVEKKHFSDAADVAFYWFFIVLVWIPLYVLSFLAPHWMR